MADNENSSFSDVVSNVHKLDDSTCTEYYLVKNKKAFLKKLKTELQNIEKEITIKETMKKEFIGKENLVDSSILSVTNMKKLVKEHQYSLLKELEREQNKTKDLNEKYMQNISKYETLWEEYEETYNSLSYVQERNNHKNRLRLLCINVIKGKVQIKEILHKLQVLKDIQEKKKQNLIVKFAELWIKRKNFLRTRAEMLEEIRSLKKYIEEKKIEKMIFNRSGLKRPRIQDRFVNEVPQFSPSTLDLLERGLTLHILPWDSPPRKTACHYQRDSTKMFRRETMSVSALTAACGGGSTVQHTVQDKVEKLNTGPSGSQENQINSTPVNASLERQDKRSTLLEDSVSTDNYVQTSLHSDIDKSASFQTVIQTGDRHISNHNSIHRDNPNSTLHNREGDSSTPFQDTPQRDVTQSALLHDIQESDARSITYDTNVIQLQDSSQRYDGRSMPLEAIVQRSDDEGTPLQTLMQESVPNKPALQRNDVRSTSGQTSMQRERITTPLYNEMEYGSSPVSAAVDTEISSNPLQASMQKEGISTPAQAYQQKEITNPLQTSMQRERISSSLQPFMQREGISTPIQTLMGRGIASSLQASMQREYSSTPLDQAMGGKDKSKKTLSAFMQEIRNSFVSVDTVLERNERITASTTPQAGTCMQIEESTQLQTPRIDNRPVQDQSYVQKEGSTIIQREGNSQRQSMANDNLSHHSVKPRDKTADETRNDVCSTTILPAQQTSESTSSLKRDVPVSQAIASNHKSNNFSESNARENCESTVAVEEMQNSNETIEQPSATSNDGIIQTPESDQAQLFLSCGSEGSNEWDQQQHSVQNYSYQLSPEDLSGVISPRRDFLMTSPLNEEQNCTALSSPILSPDNQNANANSGGALGGLIDQTSNNDNNNNNGFNFNFGANLGTFGFSSLFQGNNSGNANNNKSGEKSKSGTVFSLF